MPCFQQTAAGVKTIFMCAACCARRLQTFAATYLPGGLLVLLLQAATPVSMGLSRALLRTRYFGTEYAGAAANEVMLMSLLWSSLTVDSLSFSMTIWRRKL